ncbi:uncharacterized protein LOC144711210 [Wolffia australiana]
MKAVLLLCFWIALLPVLIAEAAQCESGPARIDPLNGFNKYRGGYNLTNLHYWSSAAFTGVHGYVLAAVWFIVGLLLSSIFLCYGEKFRRGRWRVLWLLPLAVLLVLFAIAASGLAMAGSAGFRASAGAVEDKIGGTARDASGTIYNVTTSVTAIQGERYISERLVNASAKLGIDASALQRKAERNLRMISRGLKILHASTVTLASVCLVSALGLLGSRVLGLRRTFILLVCLSWVLISLCWATSGLYFFVDRFAGDTCQALEEYQRDARNSSLGELIPCEEELPGRGALRDVRSEISGIIDKVNKNISVSFGAVGAVCNPFSPPPEFMYQPQSCASGEIRVGDIPKILETYACSEGEAGNRCEQGKFISASDFRSTLIFTSSLQNILNSFQAVENLANCRMIKEAFSDILNEECGPMKKWARTAWAAMTALAVAASLLLFSLAPLSNNDRQRSSAVDPLFAEEEGQGKAKMDVDC